MHDQRRSADFARPCRRGASEDEHAAHLRHGLHDAHDLIARDLSIGQRRSRRQLGRNRNARCVFVGNETRRELRGRLDRQHENDHSDGERQITRPPCMQRPGQQPRVGSHDDAIAKGLFGNWPHQISRHHRRDKAGNEQREQHGCRDRQSKLFKVLPRDPRHEGHRREDRDNRERDGNHSEPYFVGCFDRGTIG